MFDAEKLKEHQNKVGNDLAWLNKAMLAKVKDLDKLIANAPLGGAAVNISAKSNANRDLESNAFNRRRGHDLKLPSHTGRTPSGQDLGPLKNPTPAPNGPDPLGGAVAPGLDSKKGRTVAGGNGSPKEQLIAAGGVMRANQEESAGEADGEINSDPTTQSHYWTRDSLLQLSPEDQQRISEAYANYRQANPGGANELEWFAGQFSRRARRPAGQSGVSLAGGRPGQRPIIGMSPGSALRRLTKQS